MDREIYMHNRSSAHVNNEKTNGSEEVCLASILMLHCSSHSPSASVSEVFFFFFFLPSFDCCQNMTRNWFNQLTSERWRFAVVEIFIPDMGLLAQKDFSLLKWVPTFWLESMVCVSGLCSECRHNGLHARYKANAVLRHCALWHSGLDLSASGIRVWQNLQLYDTDWLDQKKKPC